MKKIYSIMFVLSCVTTSFIGYTILKYESGGYISKKTFAKDKNVDGL